MRKSSLFVRSAVVAGLAFAASCGSDSATSPKPAAASLSTAISQTTYGDASSFASARSLTSVPGAAAPTFDPAVCTYSSSDNAFSCPSKSASGVSFQLKYFLYDAAGVAMNAYDAATTASLRTVWDATGTFTTSGTSSSTVQLTHHSDMTLAGLLGTTRTLNGTSTDHDIVDTGSGTQAVHAVIDVAGSATNVVLPAAAGQYPASGSLASNITATSASGGFSTVATLHGTLTFDGTNFATLTLSSGIGTTSCRIDLAGAAAPHCGI